MSWPRRYLSANSSGESVLSLQVHDAGEKAAPGTGSAGVYIGFGEHD
jgi:hypothetical protein